MARLSWIQTREGWRSGRYQIELAAPHLWVLSRVPRRGSLSPIEPVTVLRTGGSLRELKHAADALEARRVKARRLLIHLASVAVLAGIAVAVPDIDSPWFILSVAALFTVTLRTVVVWIDMVTGSAWARLSDVYQ